MDKIEFRLTYFSYAGHEYSDSAINIFINSKNLLPRIHEFEKSVGCNGGHAPMYLDILHSSLAEDYKTEVLVPIYCCGCGDIDCSAIYISVEVDDETVTWKNFILPDENLRDEFIYERRFGEFVFDKAQYFREVEKLKLWRDNDSLTVEYGGVECGDIKLVVNKAQTFEFYFDELLDDPLPDLVKFFNAVRGGEDHFETKLVWHNESDVLKLSLEPWFDEKVRFYVELVHKKLVFCQWLRREELADMFKKIFNDLLNDKYFPYSYPCFWYLGEEADPNGEVIDAIEEAHPDWETGDVWNYAVATGQLKLTPRHEKYLEHYKRMLSDYIIPDKWFE